MKTSTEILAPLVPFFTDDALTDICINVPSKGGTGDDDEDRGGRGRRPKAPGPMPSPALA